MVSFFRRKKPQDPAPAPASNRFSAQELAAAFPQAPTSAGPTPALDGDRASAEVQLDAAASPADATSEATAIAPPAAAGAALGDRGVPQPPGRQAGRLEGGQGEEGQSRRARQRGSLSSTQV